MKDDFPIAFFDLSWLAVQDAPPKAIMAALDGVGSANVQNQCIGRGGFFPERDRRLRFSLGFS